METNRWCARRWMYACVAWPSYERKSQNCINKMFSERKRNSLKVYRKRFTGYGIFCPFFVCVCFVCYSFQMLSNNDDLFAVLHIYENCFFKHLWSKYFHATYTSPKCYIALFFRCKMHAYRFTGFGLKLYFTCNPNDSFCASRILISCKLPLKIPVSFNQIVIIAE